MNHSIAEAPVTPVSVQHGVEGLEEALERLQEAGIAVSGRVGGRAHGEPQEAWETVDGTPISFVYVLSDVTGYARYVGETRNPYKRRMSHWYNKQYDSGNMPLKHWLRALPEPPTLHVIEAVPFAERYAEEEGWTYSFRWALGDGLLNINSGAQPGELTRARMSAAKTPEARALISQRLKGRTLPMETRAKISASLRARYATAR